MVVIELVYRKGSQQQGPSGDAGAKWRQKHGGGGGGGGGRGPSGSLPRFNHFVPIEPWAVKKIKPRRIRVMPK